MHSIRSFLHAASFFALLLLVCLQAAAVQTTGATQPESAATRLNELGPENGTMARLVGLWDVSETVWAAPNAAPVVLTGLTAERRMVGQTLQETLRSTSDPSGKILRMDYLSFNRVEGRWEYVSIDTRAAVGIMTAQSFGRDKDDHVLLTFQPFAIPGPQVMGQMLRMRQEINSEAAGRNQKDQYFIMADGGSTEWLAHRYTYVLRSATGTAAPVSVPQPGASSRIDAIKQRGALRVAVLNEYPWLKQSASGSKSFQGPAWLLANEYAKRLGVRLETVPVNFENKVSVLASDQVDITIAPLLDTPERDKTLDFVNYSMSAQCLFGLADNPKLALANSIDDLNRPDVSIGYIKGSPQGAWLEKRLPKAARRPTAGNLADIPLKEITLHQADVASIDKFFFAGIAEKTPGLITLPKGDACLTSNELPIPIGLAVSKNQLVFIA